MVPPLAGLARGRRLSEAKALVLRPKTKLTEIKVRRRPIA